MSIHCDLRRIYGALAASLPRGEDPDNDASVSFHRGNLPVPPDELHSDQLVLCKGEHVYNGWYRADAVSIELGHRTARELGLFLLACMFHGPARDVWLRFDHPDSQVRHLVVPCNPFDGPLEARPTMMPCALRYHPSEPFKHPWTWQQLHPEELPLLALTTVDQTPASDEDWRRRDTLRQASSYEGTLRFGELLLNAGCPIYEQREYALEGDAGFRGVAPMSAEITLWLPGSFGWGGRDGLER